MGIQIIEILIVMAFSAFFSGMEIAFVSSNKMQFEMEKSDMRFSAGILSQFYKHPNNFISTMLVGNNIALVIFGILMASLINRYILFNVHNGFVQLTLQTLISTLIILFTGEFIPKTVFKKNPNLSMRLFSMPLFICYVVLYPLSRFTSLLSSVMLRLFGVKVNREASNKAFSKVDLDYFVQAGIEAAEKPEELEPELKIFKNALDFSEVKVRDCFVPRTEIVAVDQSETLDKLRETFTESGMSKVIVYNKNIDNIIGYIHSSELFRPHQAWTEGIQSVPIVPETMPVHKLMTLFMQQKKSIAIVVDEFGGTSGVVTMEDIVEEIFGDIEDEHDNTNYVCRKVSANEYILSARLEIEKLNDEFDLNLPESEEYLTVGGLILNKYQGFPRLHEVVEIGDYKFKILKISETKIELVKMQTV